MCVDVNIHRVQHLTKGFELWRERTDSSQMEIVYCEA